MLLMKDRQLAVVVLAAGQGTRMKSNRAKVLHELSGIPMIGHVMATANALQPEHVIVVVRHQRSDVALAAAQYCPNTMFIDQDDIPGTGRALEMAIDALPKKFSGDVCVVSGDVPLLDSDTILAARGHHIEQGATATLLSAVVSDPSGYGRVIRNDSGLVKRIVEDKDASNEEVLVTEVNSGTYLFDGKAVREALSMVHLRNSQGEKYLTDVVEIINERDGEVHAIQVEDFWLLEGINDRFQLGQSQLRLNRMIVRGWQLEGVTFQDPESCVIDLGVKLATDVEILPGVQLLGQTRVGEGAKIGPDSTLRDTQVGERSRLIRTHAEGANIGADSQVGPFAYLRGGTVIEDEAKVGTFVEVKQSTLQRGVRVPHLSYIGDAEIGEGTNIGAGAITANYDGVSKHRTKIGSNVRTGSNTVFVAPVEIGDGAYGAAGAVIRRNVPPGALAVTVAQQRNVEGWVEANRGATPPAAGLQDDSRDRK